MKIKTIQDILPFVEMPSRYLGTEINSVKKDDDNVRLRIVLAFPDMYEIGTSHFGLQILYHILNKRVDIAAERVFAPGVDMGNYLKSSNISLMSLESHKPLKKFDIIGFSLLYELNYTNVLFMLDLANIPFFASQRDNSFPFIIAGGPCTCNPEPVADFFDAMVIGDGENVVLQMADLWLEWKENCHSDKKILLKQWSKIEGVYIPSFFKPQFDEHGFQTLTPVFSDYKIVSRAILSDIDNADFPNAPVIPYARPIHDRVRLEVSRGCSRGCRFCQAGMIYRPVRERSVKNLLELANVSIAATGYEDISLLSLSTGDYGCLTELMRRLMNWCEPRRIAVSLPSLRAGTLTPELMNLIKKVRKTGFTIAPEAGSQRLRDIINKNITEEYIIDTVRNAFELGWKVIKLYFMIGLPFENDDDLQAIIDLVKKLRKIKNGSKSQKSQINVSVTTFIPKAHTPFQWESQISLSESKEKIRWLRSNLENMHGIHFKWQNPEISELEGLFARGDRRLANLIETAYKSGCKFDGWTDKFRYDLWKKAIQDKKINVDFYTNRSRNTDEPLPWNNINAKISKEFLKRELKKSAVGELTSDCRTEDCNLCGVCDFETVKPQVFKTCNEEFNVELPSQTSDNYKKFQVRYSKTKNAKYFGHLELANIFLRAIKRADISVDFSKGFHPKPKVSFEDPLPIGMESLNETLYLLAIADTAPEFIKEGLNQHLPNGVKVNNCCVFVKSASNKSKSATYIICIKNDVFDKDKLNNFTNSKQVNLTRVNKKGKTKITNLKESVLAIDLPAQNKLQMTLSLEAGKTARPLSVIKIIFNMPDEILKQASVVKQ